MPLRGRVGPPRPDFMPAYAKTARPHEGGRAGYKVEAFAPGEGLLN